MISNNKQGNPYHDSDGKFTSNSGDNSGEKYSAIKKLGFDANQKEDEVKGTFNHDAWNHEYEKRRDEAYKRDWMPSKEGGPDVDEFLGLEPMKREDYIDKPLEPVNPHHFDENGQFTSEEAKPDLKGVNLEEEIKGTIERYPEKYDFKAKDISPEEKEKRLNNIKETLMWSLTDFYKIPSEDAKKALDIYLGTNSKISNKINQMGFGPEEVK